MPPFLAFRLWLREGPAGERTAAAVVATVVLAVLIAALVPVAEGSGGGSSLAVGSGGGATGGPGGAGAAPGAAGGAASGSSGAGAPGAAGTGGINSAGGTGGATSAGGAGAVGGPTSATGCGALTASAPGVTSTTVQLDMANLSLAGPIGNSTFHVRPDLPQIATALANDINAHGGVACGRKLKLKQYNVNPLDAGDSQTKCLEMASDHP